MFTEEEYSLYKIVYWRNFFPIWHLKLYLWHQQRVFTITDELLAHTSSKALIQSLLWHANPPDQVRPLFLVFLLLLCWGQQSLDSELVASGPLLHSLHIRNGKLRLILCIAFTAALFKRYGPVGAFSIFMTRVSTGCMFQVKCEQQTQAKIQLAFCRKTSCIVVSSEHCSEQKMFM